MVKIDVNSKTIFVDGEVSINNGLLLVNRELFLSLRRFSENNIIIKINGDLKSFTVDACNSVQINGMVQKIKMENSKRKVSKDQGLSLGDERPFSSKKFTDKNIDIFINGNLELLTVDSYNSLKVNGDEVSLQE